MVRLELVVRVLASEAGVVNQSGRRLTTKPLHRRRAVHDATFQN